MSKGMRWWENHQPKIDGFLDKAKDRGCATCSEINEVLPERQIDGAEIEEFLAFLDEIGIRVIDDP